jgi:serpin B
MRRLLSAVVVALCLCILSFARMAPANTQPPEESVAPMNNAFAADLYAQLSSKEGNLFFSPTSIQTALAMAWAGARGQTANEMAGALHLDPTASNQLAGFLNRLNADGEKGGYELAVANALWGLKGYPFIPDYLNLVKKNYGGHLSELDFGANPDGSRQTINDWVAKQTHDRIKDLLGPGAVDGNTRLVLTNAIYFKASWDMPFQKRATRDGPFTAAGGKAVTVPFMFQREHFRYAEDDDVQVLELTYGNFDLAMRIFLPKNPGGLGRFEKQMTDQRLSALAGKLASQEVLLTLPKFTSESEFSLADTLKAMGIKLAFDPNRADFKGMTTSEQLFISAVIHKAFVKVDEEGTEAAAATGIAMAGAVMPITKPKSFNADHPFMFEIVHHASGAVLFMGRLAKP